MKESNNKYYNTYVAIYNQSVEHDNALGHCDQKWACGLARTWANINLKTKNAIEKFMNGWYDFYYHMFD